MRRLFKVTSPAAHPHLTRARCHGLLARCAAHQSVYGRRQASGASLRR